MSAEPIDVPSADPNVELVAALLKGGAIKWTPQALRLACTIAGVSTAAVRDRVDAMGRDGARYRPPQRIQAVAVDEGRVAELVAELEERDRHIVRLQAELERAVGTVIKKKAPRKDAAEIDLDENGQPIRKRCARCRRKKPITAFYLKNVRTGLRHSFCDPCRIAYQAERYLTVSKTTALNEVGLEFVIGDNDDEVGLVCTACKRPLEVGQRVVGHAQLHHVECPGAT